jgi:integrase
MVRKRSPENVGLPMRWRQVHGAYYYQVPLGLEHLWNGKKLYRLGKTLTESYRAWADRVDKTDKSSTVADLLERYALEIVPRKAISTQPDQLKIIRQLTGVFGQMQLDEIRPQFIYKYIDKRTAKTVTSTGRTTGGAAIARREVKVLSHALTKAVEWGYLDRHPFYKELRLEGSQPRTRYIEDWEILECLKLGSKRTSGSILTIQAYIRIKLMTGMARGDLLRLTMSDITTDGIKIQRHKTAKSTGKRTTYEMTPDLQVAIDMAKSSRPVLSKFLFCTRNGLPYINEQTGMAHGWDSMWQRFMTRVLSETKVAERFTEHDLRAKCASDAASLDHARALLSHADSRVTNAVYRRRPERVKPLQGVK